MEKTSPLTVISKVAVGIMIIFLILSFAVWGIGDVFRSGGRDEAARVGDEVITLTEYQRELSAETQRLQYTMGQVPSDDMLRQLGVPQRIIAQLINRSLFSQASEDIGIAVTEQDAVDTIRSDIQFERQEGGFDRQRFENFLRFYGYSEAGYVNVVKSEIASERLVDALTAQHTLVGDLTDALYAYEHEQRKATLLVIEDRLSDIPAPTEQALEAYYQQHQEKYMVPESRDVTYVELTLESIADEVGVSEEDLQLEFDIRADDYGPQELRDLKQLVVETKEDAERLLAELESTSFEKVAKAEGKSKDDTSYGETSYSDLLALGLLPVDAVDAIFDAAEGEATGPHESSLGYHIFYIADVRETKPRTFDEVKDELRLLVLQDQGTDVLYDLSTAVEDALAGGASMEEIAQRYNLVLKTVEGLTQNPEADLAETLPTYGDFMPVAFALQTGEISPLAIQPTGEGYYISRVDTITPASVKPLDEVMVEVKAGWESAKRQELLKQKAASIGQRLANESMKSLESIAREVKADVESYGPVKQDEYNPDMIPNAAQRELFTLKKGKTGRAHQRDDGAFVIARVDEIITPEPDEIAQAVIHGTIANEQKQDLLEQYIVYLQDKHPVEVYIEY